MTGRVDNIRTGGGHRTDRHHVSTTHDGTTLAVSRGGSGHPVVLCPGLYSTQAGLRGLLELLRREHEVIAFDLRGHGLSTAATRYSFADFLADLSAVVPLGQRGDRAPVLVGYSLGADLAVHYAAAHPAAVSGLVLVDGANPIPEPFLPPADVPEFTAMWEKSVTATTVDAAHRVSLTPQQILALNLELDTLRTGPLLHRFRDVTAPIDMVVSTRMAGDGSDDRTRWRNSNWRTGVRRLAEARPDLDVTWLDADHRLVTTHAPEIARIVADRIARTH